MKEHLPLARKYRPQDFSDFTGQAPVVKQVRQTLRHGRIGSAYLFAGPRGTGKTTMARLFAKGINCEKGPTPDPCGECASCREIAAGGSLDVLEIDAASHTRVEETRAVILDNAGLAPARDRFRIFLIDEAHMLSAGSFNALLKTLEEPPANVTFLLATTAPEKIPETVHSRCHRLEFRPLPVEDILARLGEICGRENLSAEKAALEVIAEAAEGSLRDAVSLLDQASVLALTEGGGGSISEASVREMLGLLPLERVRELAARIGRCDERAAVEFCRDLLAEGRDPTLLLRQFRDHLRGLLLEQVERGDPADGKGGEADGWGVDRLVEALKVLGETLSEMRISDLPRLGLEVAVIRLARSPASVRERSSYRAAAKAAPQPPSPSAQTSADPEDRWRRFLALLEEREELWLPFFQDATAEETAGRVKIRLADEWKKTLCEEAYSEGGGWRACFHEAFGSDRRPVLEVAAGPSARAAPKNYNTIHIPENMAAEAPASSPPSLPPSPPSLPPKQPSASEVRRKEPAVAWAEEIFKGRLLEGEPGQAA